MNKNFWKDPPRKLINFLLRCSLRTSPKTSTLKSSWLDFPPRSIPAPSPSPSSLLPGSLSSWAHFFHPSLYLYNLLNKFSLIFWKKNPKRNILDNKGRGFLLNWLNKILDKGRPESYISRMGVRNLIRNQVFGGDGAPAVFSKSPDQILC